MNDLIEKALIIDPSIQEKILDLLNNPDSLPDYYRMNPQTFYSSFKYEISKVVGHFSKHQELKSSECYSAFIDEMYRVCKELEKKNWFRNE